MQDVQPSRTPQESAEHLAEALDNNTTALNKVKNRYRWMLAYIVIASLVVGMAFKFNYDSNVDRCEAGNELRVELNEKFQKLSIPLIAAGVGDTTSGRELLITLEEDLEPRDCTDINWLGR
jgi:hypothetical protein